LEYLIHGMHGASRGHAPEYATTTIELTFSMISTARSVGLITLAAITSMAAACSLDTTSTQQTPLVGPTGTIALSGTIAGNFGTLPIVIRCAGAGTSSCTLGIVSQGSTPYFVATVYFPAAPAVRTYASADADAHATIGVGDSFGAGARSWHASVFQGSGSGSYSLVVTEVSAPSQGVGGLEYLIHGTLDATMTGTPPTTGTVSAHVVF
jgi:hypothetical protein